MSKKGIYTQTEYAKLKQVSQPYIAKLVKKNKLYMVVDPDAKKFVILDCQYNDDLFYKKSIQKTYIMHDSDKDLYKIGKSMNPYKRLEDINKIEKCNMYLLMVCDDNIELKLHKHYKHKNIERELFNLDINDLEELINVFKFKKIK